MELYAEDECKSLYLFSRVLTLCRICEYSSDSNPISAASLEHGIGVCRFQELAFLFFLNCEVGVSSEYYILLVVKVPLRALTTLALHTPL